ncbi:MAG TPA: cyclic nucleotide-binding domain-containing protein [Anaerolineales bacterium]|nr:cyclic nucleotide-binding domain-containing protein [Anaerolineales bacterium]
MHRVAIFKELSQNQLDLLRPLFELFACGAGTVILEQGAPAEHLYLLISGTAEMSFKPYDGHPFTLSYVEKGGLFGWSAVVGSKKYSSSAIAVTNVEAFRVRGAALRQFCREHPEAGIDILERLADGVSFRWKDAHRQIKSLIVQGMTKKSIVY